MASRGLLDIAYALGIQIQASIDGVQNLERLNLTLNKIRKSLVLLRKDTRNVGKNLSSGLNNLGQSGNRAASGLSRASSAQNAFTTGTRALAGVLRITGTTAFIAQLRTLGFAFTAASSAVQNFGPLFLGLVTRFGPAGIAVGAFAAAISAVLVPALIAGIAVIGGFGLALTKIVPAGIEFNQTLESARINIQALIAQFSDLRTVDGTLITDPAEKFAASTKIANEALTILRGEAIRTNFTVQQLVPAFTAARTALAGVPVTVKQTAEVTAQLTRAAQVLNLDISRLPISISQVLAGLKNVRNPLQRFLEGMGLGAQEIRKLREEAKQAGNADRFIEILNDKLKTFNIAADAATKTWTGLTSNFQEAFETLGGEATSKFFDVIRQGLIKVVEQGVTTTDEITGLQKRFEGLFNPAIFAPGFKTLAEGQEILSKPLVRIRDVISEILEYIGEDIVDAVIYLITQLDNVADWAERNRDNIIAIWEYTKFIILTTGRILNNLIEAFGYVDKTESKADEIQTTADNLTSALRLIVGIFAGIAVIASGINILILTMNNYLLAAIAAGATLQNLFIGIYNILLKIAKLPSIIADTATGGASKRFRERFNTNRLPDELPFVDIPNVSDDYSDNVKEIRKEWETIVSLIKQITSGKGLGRDLSSGPLLDLPPNLFGEKVTEVPKPDIGGDADSKKKASKTRVKSFNTFREEKALTEALIDLQEEYLKEKFEALKRSHDLELDLLEDANKEFLISDEAYLDKKEEIGKREIELERTFLENKREIRLAEFRVELQDLQDSSLERVAQLQEQYQDETDSIKRSNIEREIANETDKAILQTKTAEIKLAQDLVKIRSDISALEKDSLNLARELTKERAESVRQLRAISLEIQLANQESKGLFSASTQFDKVLLENLETARLLDSIITSGQDKILKKQNELAKASSEESRQAIREEIELSQDRVQSAFDLLETLYESLAIRKEGLLVEQEFAKLDQRNSVIAAERLRIESLLARGLITTRQAHAETVRLRREELKVIEAQIKALESKSGKQAKDFAQLIELKVRLEELKSIADPEIFNIISDIRGEFEDLFVDLQTNISNAGDAFRSFASNILKIFQQLLAKKIVRDLFEGVLFPDEGQTAGKPRGVFGKILSSIGKIFGIDREKQAQKDADALGDVNIQTEEPVNPDRIAEIRTQFEALLKSESELVAALKARDDALQDLDKIEAETIIASTVETKEKIKLGEDAPVPGSITQTIPENELVRRAEENQGVLPSDDTTSIGVVSRDSGEPDDGTLVPTSPLGGLDEDTIGQNIATNFGLLEKNLRGTLVDLGNKYVIPVKNAIDAIYKTIGISEGQTLSSSISTISSRFETLVQAISNSLPTIAEAVGNIKVSTDKIASTLSPLGAATGKAYGGYISGRGGPTDDLIPAWLSDGEFVIRAASVKKLGLPLLNALNGAKGFQGGGLASGIFGGLLSVFRSKLFTTALLPFLTLLLQRIPGGSKFSALLPLLLLLTQNQTDKKASGGLIGKPKLKGGLFGFPFGGGVHEGIHAGAISGSSGGLSGFFSSQLGGGLLSLGIAVAFGLLGRLFGQKQKRPDRTPDPFGFNPDTLTFYKNPIITGVRDYLSSGGLPHGAKSPRFNMGGLASAEATLSGLNSGMMSGGSGQNIINQKINIQAQDVNSFRKSKATIEKDLARATQRGLKRPSPKY